MTGTIYVKDVNPLILQSTNKNLDIWRVTGDSTAWNNTYGFYLRYNGAGSGNDNSLSLWANNQAGNDIEVYRVKQDGILNFLKAPTINGTSISLTTHDHDDKYLKLSGSTMTGAITASINSSTVADLTKGINFGEGAHIGYSTGLGLYSKGEIWIRPAQSSLSTADSTKGLKITGTTFTYNNTNVSLEGHTHSEYVTSVGVTDDTTNHANQLRYVKNGTSTYFTVPYAEVAGKTGAYLTNKYNTLSAAKGREITVNGQSSVIISGCNLNSGGRFLIWLAGYGPTSIRCTYRILEPGSIKVEYTENASIIIYNTSASEMRFTVTGLLGSFTIGDEVDVPASYSTQSIALYSNTWSSYIGTSSNKVSYAINADIASNLNKSTLGYLYQSATTTTGSTGTVTATSGKIGVPIQFYGSQVNYALNNDLFYATVASNAITANTIYLGDAIKSKTFVKTSTHVPTGASSSSSSSGTSGESITYTAGNGIKIAGTQISTNTWTGTESQFAELANPSSYDLIYIIED